jgi:hypothetical protein
MYGIIDKDCFSFYGVNPTSVTQRILKKLGLYSVGAKRQK